MITSINKNNAARYTALFREVEGKLGYAEGTITTLEDYFSRIQDLARDYSRKYTILPLDEEHLFIDANSRKITIPEAFRKNGIAVQGDQVAEIVYFKINRYFDATDLNNCDIFIQWEQVTSDGNGASGVSIEYVRDIESDPDYLIFGWPIDDRITENAGSIKFSVRFIQLLDDPENPTEKMIGYSFSTLDAIATINPALDFDQELLVPSDDINEMILQRLVNTTTNTGGVAATPKWTLQLKDPIDGDLEADLNEEGKLTLKVQAFPEGQGHLSYKWKKDSIKELSSEILYEKIDKYIADAEGELTIPVTADADKLYYKLDSDGVTYKLIDTLKPGDPLTEITGDVYEQFATLTVDEVGEYQAIATNTVALVGQGINSASIESNVLVVPGPVKANFGQESIASVIMSENTEGTAYELAVSVSPVVDTAAANTYSWYKNSSAIEGANSTSYNKTILKTEATAEEQGLYQLEVVSTRNNDTTNALSAGFIVTYPAIKPTVTYDNTFAYAGNAITATPGFANDYQKSEYQNITYQWYVDKANADYKIEGATEATYTVELSSNVTLGSFIYCEITNNYNGDIQITTGTNIPVVGVNE